MPKRKNERELDRMAEAAAWYLEFRKTNNRTFLPLFADRHRYLVLKGGGGSGKSIFAGRKILERAATESGHRFLVVRKVARTLRESCYEQLKRQAAEFYQEDVAFIPRGKGSDMYLRFKNGSEIIFAGLDDVEKLKSIYGITGIWIEEASEVTMDDFDQLDIRLRTQCPHYLQIILTFNPISATHWLKARFFDMDVRDPALKKELQEKTRIHESTYKDNRFLPEEQIRVLESYRETNEYYYQVYCLGMWGVTGKTVFDAAKVSQRLQEIGPPVKQGFFEYDYDGLTVEGIRWTEEAAGVVKVYREPEEGVPYVIGADTAGTGSDFFVGQVLDNRTGEQVCTLRGHFDEDVFARQLYCLGMWYNGALIAPETNFSTAPTVELERMRYPRLYVRETFDSYTHRPKPSYGFLTTVKTRQEILSVLIAVVRDHPELICDEDTLNEMLTFVRNEALRPEAEQGAHDDCVMALAIAHRARDQQRVTKEVKGKKARWTEDMLEDYRNASPEEKKMLRSKWG